MSRIVLSASLTLVVFIMGATFWRLNAASAPLAVAGVAFVCIPIVVGEARLGIATRRAHMRAAILDSSCLLPVLSGPWIALMRALAITVASAGVIGWLALAAQPPMLLLCGMTCFVTALLTSWLCAQSARHFRTPFAEALSATVATCATGLIFLFPAMWVELTLTDFSAAIADSSTLPQAMLQGIREAPPAAGWLRDTVAVPAALDAAALWIADRDGIRNWGLLLLALRNALCVFVLARAAAVSATLIRRLLGGHHD